MQRDPNYGQPLERQNLPLNFELVNNMSKFVDNIVGQLLPGRKQVYEKLEVNQTVEETKPYSYTAHTLNTYKIEVRYGVTGNTHPEFYPLFLENFKKELLFIIYGDLMHDMHRLHEALYQHDFNKSIEILNDMQDEIYGINKAKASTRI